MRHLPVFHQPLNYVEGALCNRDVRLDCEILKFEGMTV